MAEIVKIIDPDMGIGYDYDSLFDWEAGQQQDLTDGGGDIAVAKCRCTGGTVDSTIVAISGWTTNSSCYIKIWTDPSESYRHTGIFPSGNKYRISVSLSNQVGINVDNRFVRIDGIALTAGVTGLWAVGIGNYTSFNDLSDFRVSNCVIQRTGSSTYSSGLEFKLNDVDAAARAWNNIIYDFSGSTPANHRAVHIDAGSSSATLYCYNCTAVDCSTGYSNGIGADVNFIATNCGSSGATTGFTSYITQTTCSSSTPSFVNSGADDFHLSPGDTIWQDQGTSNPGSGLFSDDIDGQTRTGSWDIGADEYLSLSIHQSECVGTLGNLG